VNAEILLAPELTLVGDRFESGLTVGVDASTGLITRVAPAGAEVVAGN